MKYLSVLLFFIVGLGCVNSYAQDAEKQKRISLKLYSQIMADVNDQPNRLSIGISPAISFSTEGGSFQELELSDFFFSKENYNNKRNNDKSLSIRKRVGMRYSFNYSINKQGKLRAFIGAGVNTNLSAYKHEYNYPGIMDMAQEGEFKMFTSSIDLNITPRLVWNVSDKWFIDLNIPVNVYNLTNNVQQTDDVQSKFKTSSSKAFPNNYTVNVGLGFKF